MLEKNPDDRISSEDLLEHPWFNDVKDATSVSIETQQHNFETYNALSHYSKNNKLYKALKMFTQRFNSNNSNIN